MQIFPVTLSPSEIMKISSLVNSIISEFHKHRALIVLWLENKCPMKLTLFVDPYKFNLYQHAYSQDAYLKGMAYLLEIHSSLL